MNLTETGPSKDLRSQIDRDGYAIIRGLISHNLIEELRDLSAIASTTSSASRRGQSVYGIRNLLSISSRIREIISNFPFQPLVAAIAGVSAKPVKGVFFDKPPGANWPVSWHQDVTICVEYRREVPGFEARPVRDGMVHLLPPVELSEQMLALRIHLDDATAAHGALRVVPGSHRFGRLANEQIEELCHSDTEICAVAAGDVMLMRPLLIHASSPCERPNHRRVIHVEYAAFELPGGLEWQG
jgi:hypothetical protein